VNEAIDYCAKFELGFDATQDLYRLAGAQMRMRKDYGKAIMYFIQAQENESIELIVGKVLEDYLRNKGQDDGQQEHSVFHKVLQPVADYVDSNEYLMFLQGYSEIQKALRQKSFQVAADRISEMLVHTDISMKRFIPLLLIDCAQIMRGNYILILLMIIMVFIWEFNGCRII
jgi:hypothetical protein